MRRKGLIVLEREERFGPNGAWVPGMSEEMKRRYDERRGFRSVLRWQTVLRILPTASIVAIGTFSLVWLNNADWYVPPAWAWPTMCVVLFVGPVLAFPIVKTLRVVRGDPSPIETSRLFGNVYRIGMGAYLIAVFLDAYLLQLPAARSAVIAP